LSIRGCLTFNHDPLKNYQVSWLSDVSHSDGLIRAGRRRIPGLIYTQAPGCLFALVYCARYERCNVLSESVSIQSFGRRVEGDLDLPVAGDSESPELELDSEAASSVTCGRNRLGRQFFMRFASLSCILRPPATVTVTVTPCGPVGAGVTGSRP
jgi:hypothetical protein